MAAHTKCERPFFGAMVRGRGGGENVRWLFFMRRGLVSFLLAGLIVILSVVALAAVKSPSFGLALSHQVDGDWSGMTTQWAISLKNWELYGPGHFRFLHSLQPVSIEAGPAGAIYSSYPPGVNVWPYLWGKLSGRESSVGTLMFFSGVFQLLTALLFYSLLFKLFRGQGIGEVASAVMAGAIAATVNFTTPAVVYFQTLWTPDVAVLPLFFALVLVELRYAERPSGALRVLACVLLALAMFTEWIALPLLVTVMAVRWARGERGRSYVLLCASALAPLAAQAFLSMRQIPLSLILQKAMERFGLGAGAERGPGGYLWGFWSGTMMRDYTLIPWLLILAVVFASAALLLRRSWRRPELMLFPLVVVPCVLHNLMLAQHHFFHEFNSLKFIYVFGLGLAGLALIVCRVARSRFSPFVAALLLCLVFIPVARFSLGYYWRLHPVMLASSYARDSYLDKLALASFIKRHARFEHVFFQLRARGFFAGVPDPVVSGYGHKNAYPVDAPSEIEEMLRKMPGGGHPDVRPMLVAAEELRGAWSLAGGKLIAREGKFALYELQRLSPRASGNASAPLFAP
jgi:hypothetical protein